MTKSSLVSSKSQKWNKGIKVLQAVVCEDFDQYIFFSYSSIVQKARYKWLSFQKMMYKAPFFSDTIQFEINKYKNVRTKMNLEYLNKGKQT